jgi:excisionase family DNA binding protein
VEIIGRPEGGLGETGPLVVSPSPTTKARRDVVATLHQLLDTLTELANDVPEATAASPIDNLPLLLNALEAGRLLSISRSKVLDLAARGQIPSIRIGGSVRIPRDLLITWIDGQARDAVGSSVPRIPAWARVNRSEEV